MRDQFKAGGIELDHALGFRVYRLNQLFRAALYRAFEAEGHAMTPEQWIVLVRLWQDDGATQTELVESTLKDKATLSRILDVMERNGLVLRRLDPVDARSRRVHLTRVGKDLRASFMPVVRAMVERIEAGIPEADLEVARRTMLRLEANLAGLRDHG
jgi:DNA-binding MarR family transcriptional regulator